MEYLSKLFGSPARVKLLRLFLFQSEVVFDRDTVVRSAHVTPDTASKELAGLARAGIIKRKTFYKEVVRPGSKIAKKRKTIGWVLNTKYPYLDALSVFLRSTLSVSDTEIRKRFRGIGSIRLLVLSGFLMGRKKGGLDMLIVGNKLNTQLLRNIIRSLEAEFGQEICYAVFTVEEYQYRRRIRDKLVRDAMDFDHRALINRVSVT